MKICKGILYFLLSPTGLNYAKNITDESSTTIDTINLENCQQKICQQWNEFIHTKSYQNMPSIPDWLDTYDFRCNASNFNYNPYTSTINCIKDLCKISKLVGKKLKECFIDTDQLASLWNKFCPKKAFNKLSFIQKPKFFKNCLEKICYDKNHGLNISYKFLCMPVNLKKSIRKLQKLFKDSIKKEKKESDNKIEPSQNGLSIASSVLGITSSVVGIASGGVGLYAAKVALTSVNEALPRVSHGLQCIVDGTLAYARRASTLPSNTGSNFLNPVVPNDNELSQISSEINIVYQDALSSQRLFSQRSDLKELSNNFDQYSENLLVELDDLNDKPENLLVELDDLNDKPENFNKELDDLNDKPENFNKELDDLNDKPENINKELDDLDKTLEEISEGLNNLDEELKELNGVSNGLDKEGEELKVELDKSPIKPTLPPKSFWETFFESYVKKV